MTCSVAEKDKEITIKQTESNLKPNESAVDLTA